MVTMFGCESLPAECASRLKRARTSGSCSAANTSVRSSFSATLRSITVSNASKTTPIAPRPSWVRSSYLPMVVPIKPPCLPGERLSLPQAVPSPGEEIRHGRHGDAVQDGLQRLIRFSGKREDGGHLDRRDHDPDHGEQQPQLLPERLEHQLGNDAPHL